VTRDLELLTELDRRHAVEIHVTVTTVDARLARGWRGSPDPAAPAPLARLAEAGLATRVNHAAHAGDQRRREGHGALPSGAAPAIDVVAQPIFFKDRPGITSSAGSGGATPSAALPPALHAATT
jgi:hypothetical protein